MDRGKLYDAAVIGGGPAGSMAAFELSKKGFNVCIIEKKSFPRETLCGEFISREVTQALGSLGLMKTFLKLCPNPIHKFKLVFSNRKTLEAGLTFTAFGLSRSVFDSFILKQARKEGAVVLQPAEVKEIRRLREGYTLTVQKDERQIILQAKNVIAAYGRQTALDRKLNREFAAIKSHMNGVKLHVPEKYTPGFPKDEIHIYTGEGIYCGINRVDEGKVTICFLEDRTTFEAAPKMHLKFLIDNNWSLREIFSPEIFDVIDSSPIYGTGNIYFGKRNLVENGIFMAGDAAGVIAPLAGDGIAMAFQSGRLAAETLEKKLQNKLNTAEAEAFYSNEYKHLFSTRLRNAMFIQQALLNPDLAYPAFALSKVFPGLLRYLINSTRG
ncbi:MAG TPA: NAD(P)/FAD-dependent oxidoreductase [Ignavibacteriales bacterium]|nr:NAD(P)/FAD-dependent oxidoreductase [Ignavibacteriales bacterium]